MPARATVLLCLLSVTLWIGPQAAIADDDTNQCQGGPNPAVVSACKLRWAAAQVRAVQFATRGPVDPAPDCSVDADALEGRAMKVLALDRADHEMKPCIVLDFIRKYCPAADDVWTYDNQGIPNCRRLTGTFECNSTARAVAADSCGAHWEAANIRAHVAVKRYGGYSAACLLDTAATLERLADASTTKDLLATFPGPWPCGEHPKAGQTDDGLLRAFCPNDVWLPNAIPGCTIERRPPPDDLLSAVEERVNGAHAAGGETGKTVMSHANCSIHIEWYRNERRMETKDFNAGDIATGSLAAVTIPAGYIGQGLPGVAFSVAGPYDSPGNIVAVNYLLAAATEAQNVTRLLAEASDRCKVDAWLDQH